jgi:hypothetical protein
MHSLFLHILKHVETTLIKMTRFVSNWLIRFGEGGRELAMDIGIKVRKG